MRIASMRIIVGIMLVLISPKIYSHFLSNFGWIQIFNMYTGSIECDQLLRQYGVIFDESMHYAPSNSQAYLGKGLIYAFCAKDSQAFSTWQQGDIDPEELTRLGNLAQYSLGNIDLAMLLYRGGAILFPVTPNMAQYASVQLCQTTFAQLNDLSKNNKLYCQKLFNNNAQNLIFNGQFDQQFASWTGVFFFADTMASLEIDNQTGMPPPSQKLSGYSDGKHGGLYQRIQLLPGSTVRFSGYFRVKDAVAFRSRALYIEWKQYGKTQGNHAVFLNSDSDWVWIEREFKLPLDSEPYVQFYPVLLEGIGTVWVDNICVELISDE